MPLYEFRCESCGHETETLMAFSDPPPTVCEACGGPLKKLLSAPAVQFKGSGFYLTDYGRGGSGAGSSTKENGAPGTGSETKASGDAKASAGAKGGPASSAPAGSGADAKPGT
jgi:putative FmdB family regulatory protein